MKKLIRCLLLAPALALGAIDPAFASVTYSNAAGAARLTAGLNATGTAAGASVNGQTAGGGLLVIGDSSLAASCTGAHVLATVTLSSTPPFSVTNKVATLSGTPLSATPSANGTANLANMCDSGNNAVITGLTVGVCGSFDICVTTTTISTSVPVQITSGSITTQ